MLCAAMLKILIFVLLLGVIIFISCSSIVRFAVHLLDASHERHCPDRNHTPEVQLSCLPGAPGVPGTRGRSVPQETPIRHVGRCQGPPPWCLPG